MTKTKKLCTLLVTMWTRQELLNSVKRFLNKLKIRLSYYPTVPLMRIYRKTPKSANYRNICISIFSMQYENSFLITLIYVYVLMYICVIVCMWGHKTVCMSQFSSTLWVPEIKLRSSDLATSTFCPLNHLRKTIFSIQLRSLFIFCSLKILMYLKSILWYIYLYIK